MSHPYNLRKRPCPVIEEKVAKVAKVVKKTNAAKTNKNENNEETISSSKIKLDKKEPVKDIRITDEAEIDDIKSKAPSGATKTDKKGAVKKSKSNKVIKPVAEEDEAISGEDVGIESEDAAKEPTIKVAKTDDDEDVKTAPPAKTTKPVKKDVAKSVKATKETKVQEKNNFIFGQDSCGELGLSKIGFTKKQPTSMPLDNVKQIACGPFHVVTLLKSGEVYTNGCNDEGALGRVTDGDEELEAKPTLVELPNPVIKVTAGDSHSAFLTDKNEVFVVGNFRDEGGQVGLTPESKGESSFKPVQLLSKLKLTDIASGSNHMLLLDDDGNVYSFGSGEQGQLGRIDAEGLGRINDDNRNLLLTPKKVDLSNVDPNRPFICDRVFAGNYSSFATNTDKKKNRLAAWGLNNYFQLGYKGVKNQIIQSYPKRSTFTCSTSMKNVACGQHHTLFLTKSGRVHAAGRNQYGMLGFGSVVGEAICPAKLVKDVGEEIVDIFASINTSFAVNFYGTLYTWGMGGYQLGHATEDDITKPTKVEGLKDKKVVQVSSGSSFTAVVTDQ